MSSSGSEGGLPKLVCNWIAGGERAARRGGVFEKRRPTDGSLLAHAARSDADDVRDAIGAARDAQPAWAALPPVRRGERLLDVALSLRAAREQIAEVVALETGKSRRDALGETDGAVALGVFMAGEGQRLYGRTIASGVPGRQVLTLRQPLGVAALITAANTPIANVAWKVFPALVCGNAAVLKAPEDAPLTADLFAKLAQQAGLPAGLLNVLQGLGHEAGEPLVEDSRIDVISFTGSTAVGLRIAAAAARRLARVSLELGGKNPFVVCADADIERALHWAALSAWSNAGQRCAAASRIIVEAPVYERFRDALVARARALRVGPDDADDLGPVISERALARMLDALARAQTRGARVLVGGTRLDDDPHRDGFYLAPTLVEGADPDDDLSRTELFGPIAALYPARDYADALALANRSPYGLTACIHTRDFDRAIDFATRVEAGVAVVNAGTFGSEPHLPFGGRRLSGNGTREPGTEALDVYSELKNVYLQVDSARALA